MCEILSTQMIFLKISETNWNSVFRDEKRKIQHKWDNSCDWQKREEDGERQLDRSFSTDNGEPQLFICVYQNFSKSHCLFIYFVVPTCIYT